MASSSLVSVSSLNTKIKSLLETTFMHISLEGEVASLTYHTSGHLYFSVKDADSSIRCVMFKSNASRMKFRLEEGMRIIIEGSVSVYVPRGEYQFYALSIEPYGQGALALAFEQLKKSLEAKGYFDVSRKKQLPRYISSLALVTAKESAALHDMLKIAQKRWSLLDVTIVDTLVQGEQAPMQIAGAIKKADTLGVDVIVVARGGGSIEDLWAFNTEEVADAIFHATTPIVSAVGHEVDVMISDYIADLRAPTPSAAMEMILPSKEDVAISLDERFDAIKRVMSDKIHNYDRSLTHIKEMLVHLSPQRQIDEILSKIEDIKKEFVFTVGKIFAYKQREISEKIEALNDSIVRQMAQKDMMLKNLLAFYLASDPRKRVVDGWAQVLVNDKLTKLEDIDKGQKFMLQDKTTKLTVVCEDKSKI
ncbi:MAG: exodeoxyribonuclease VII large subunit [Campylobacterales bacterium]|nr:exodeoxyribonuclease VII large subunit [Campylobacterales bacterium]